MNNLQNQEDYNLLSVKELRSRLQQLGLDFSCCIEKSDLIDLLNSATARPNNLENEDQQNPMLQSSSSHFPSKIIEDNARSHTRRDVHTKGYHRLLSQSFLWGSISQRILKNSNREDEEWRGSRTKGVTKIESGPDFRKYNLTMHLNDRLDPQNSLFAVYCGTFNTQQEAENTEMFMETLLWGIGSSEDGLQVWMRRSSDELERLSTPTFYRTTDQLRLGLNPCGHCNDLHCSLRCSRCEMTFYCSREHQKAGWKLHKKQCGIQKKKRETLKTQQKEEKKVKAQMVERAAQPMRPLTHGATDPLLQAEARRCLAVAVDPKSGQFDILQALIFFDTDEGWDAGCQIGLLPALKAFLVADGESSGAGALKRTKWLQLQQAYNGEVDSITNTVLSGLASTADIGPSGPPVDTFRAMEFVVKCNGVWEAMWDSVIAVVRSGLRINMGKGSKTTNASLRCIMMENAYQTLRIMRDLLNNHSVGPALVSEYFTQTGNKMTTLFQELGSGVEMTQLSLESASYSQSGNKTELHIDVLASRLVAKFDVWAREIGIMFGFIPSLNLSVERFTVISALLAWESESVKIGRDLKSNEFTDLINNLT